MGVVLGSAVAPIALCVTWRRANKWGCICGAIAGFFAGIIAWLVTTATFNNNQINVTVGFGSFSTHNRMTDYLDDRQPVVCFIIELEKKKTKLIL